MERGRLLLVQLLLILAACRSRERTTEPAPPPPPSTAPAVEAVEDAAAPHPPFLEMYVAGWSLKDRPAAAISLTGVSDVILFSVLPKADGSLDATTNGLTDERIASASRHARAVKARVLVAVGGEKTGARFAKAPEKIARALARFVEEHSLDGVVLDVEPLSELSSDMLATLAREVKEAVAPRFVGIVVAPDASEVARLGAVVGHVDRVTVMSYVGEPSPAKEALLVDALVTLGFDRTRIGLGIGPKTLIEARENRRARVREGKAGGLALWGIMNAGGLRP